MSEIIPEHLEIELEKDVRKAYVKDENGFIRFIVSFVTLDTREMWEGNKWLVKVQEVIPPKDELFELSRQFFKEEDVQKAKNTFEKLVYDYQILVKLPKEEVDPSKIFNDTVNYREIDPNCCANCIFCVFHEDFDENNQKCGMKLLCSCKKNLRMNEYTWELLGKYARNSQITNIQDMIEIHGNCVCDNHERIKE